MASSTRKKKILKGLLMFVGLPAGAYFLYRYGTPLARFKRDAMNPKTAWGAENERYWINRGGYTASNVAGSITWHTNPANNSDYWNKYQAKGWALTQ